MIEKNGVVEYAMLLLDNEEMLKDVDEAYVSAGGKGTISEHKEAIREFLNSNNAFQIISYVVMVVNFYWKLHSYNKGEKKT